jgi:hypothetical protein
MNGFTGEYALRRYSLLYFRRKKGFIASKILDRAYIYLAEFVLESDSLSPASLRQEGLKRDDHLFKILHLALQNFDFASQLSLEQSLSSLAFPLSASFHLLRSFG